MDPTGIEVKMTPPHPGDLIRSEIVEELGLTVDEAAKILGIEQSILTDVLNACTPLSPELALRVEKAFGVGMDMLLRMQAWYDASQMRAREHPLQTVFSASCQCRQRLTTSLTSTNMLDEIIIVTTT